MSVRLRAPLLALVGVSLGSLCALPVAAGEELAHESTLVAAVPMSRLGARLPRPSLAGVDLNVLWAQYRPANTVPAKPDANGEDDTILVAFPLGSPESANQDIAKEYGLALVDSRELTALGLRLVRYRVGNGRPAEGVVANLLRDPRVERAQISVAYQTPTPTPTPAPAAPADLASGAPPQPSAAAKARPARPAVRVKGAVSVAQAPKAPEPPPALRQVAAQQPGEARLDAGDILSGGL
jgi:hypothetical protein